MGVGPGMGVDISDFVVTATGLEVLITQGDHSKIMVLDQDNKPARESDNNYLAHSFTKTSNNDYLLSGSYNLPFVEHRVVIQNQSG